MCDELCILSQMLLYKQNFDLIYLCTVKCDHPLVLLYHLTGIMVIIYYVASVVLVNQN